MNQVKKENQMRSFTLIDITELRNIINSDDKSLKRLKDELDEMHTAEKRNFVLSEKEILKATSSLMNEVAENEHDLTDKIFGIFHHYAESILSSRGLIE